MGKTKQSMHFSLEKRYLVGIFKILNVLNKIDAERIISAFERNQNEASERARLLLNIALSKEREMCTL